MPKSDHCSIGLVSPKYGEDLETMFKAAHTFGADSVFLLNNNWTSLQKAEKKDRKAERYPPYTYFPTFPHLKNDLLEKHSAELVLVETRTIGDTAEPLEYFTHPERAVYLFVGRDTNFSPELREQAAYCIKVSDDDRMTPGVAGAIVLYDRYLKGILNR